MVFENDFIQLVQYTPMTAKRSDERPFIVVPPCINKFYILDLQPENSFVALRRWARATPCSSVPAQRPQGGDLGTKTWDDYLREEGPR